MSKNILVVDDELNMLKVLSAILLKEGYSVETSISSQKALEILRSKPFDLLITDLKMPDIDGMELLKIVHEKFPDVIVIMITAHGTIETAVEAMKFGAFDYILKPFEMDQIRLRVVSALNNAEYRQKEIKVPQSIKKEKNFCKLIGTSKIMQEICSRIERVALTDSTILILGESGTGKELIARGIHNSGLRKKEPFIAVNCAAIPENLLESELFGHEKGAFTGATETRKGRFELAGKGTLFLDEIGDMSLTTQIKLLRVLQEKSFERIGSSNQILFTARIISATNKNLELSIKEGKFRTDLFYRINVIPIVVPPLRERKDDIEGLIEYFLDYFCSKFERPQVKLSSRVKELLCDYDWPGNIRELENMIEYLVVFNEKNEIDVNILPDKFKKNIDNDVIKQGKTLLKELSGHKEKEIILKYLTQFNYNRTKTAQALGINRRTLLNKIKDLGLTDQMPK